MVQLLRIRLSPKTEIKSLQAVKKATLNQKRITLGILVVGIFVILFSLLRM